MGTWGALLKQDDAFLDVYDGFYHFYDQGLSPEMVSAKILQGFSEYFDDSDDTCAAHFALALAQWETSSLDPSLLVRVKELIDSEADLQNRKERGASAVLISARRLVLRRFLSQISTPRKSVRRRRKDKIGESVERLSLPAPDGRKALVVTEYDLERSTRQTSGMVSWANGGSGIFSVARSDFDLSAEWLDSQTLNIRFSRLSKDEVRFGVAGGHDAFHNGDRVILNFFFD